MRRVVVASLILTACLLVFGGCFKHTYNVGAGSPQGAIAYKHWHHHWLFGLLRPKLQKQLDLDNFCPSGNATIHEEVSFVNGLVGALIGFIYSPTTVTIRCDDGRQAQIELSADEVSELVRDPLFPEVVAVLAPQRLEEVRLALARDAGGPRLLARATAD